MWNPFKKKTNTQVISAGSIQKQDFRNGMWVFTKEGIGILFSFGKGESVVHLVDKNGLTIKEVVFPNLTLQFAKWNQIPAARRQITKERGFYLGYE